MENKKLKIGILLIATLMVTSGIYVIWANVGTKNKVLAEANQEFSLVRPAFAQSMAAATTFLDNEAGISMYLNTGSSIDIEAVKPIIINIEKNTSDYVIGSVPLPSPFTPSDDPHCFVHKSGWIVVYYLKPTSQNRAYISKIIVWKSTANVNSPLDADKLRQALNIICTNLGKPTTNAQYYHFEYPSATNLLTVAKTTINTQGGSPATFNIQIPQNVTVYEQSWSHLSYIRDYYSDIGIGATQIEHTTNSGVTYDMIPFLPTNLLAPGPFQKVYVDGYNNYCGVCLTILYS